MAASKPYPLSLRLYYFFLLKFGYSKYSKNPNDSPIGMIVERFGLCALGASVVVGLFEKSSHINGLWVVASNNYPPGGE